MLLDYGPPHEVIRRIRVITYVTALLVISSFSITFHFTTESIAHHQQDTAASIGLCQEQSILSQRIARLALERAANSPFRPDALTRSALLEDVNLMQADHEGLLHVSLTPPPSASPALPVEQVYFASPWQLDARVRIFLGHARRLANLPASALSLEDPDLQALELQAQGSLLAALDASIAAREQASASAVDSLRHVRAAITVLILVMLLLEALLLYRPLFKRLARAHGELVREGRTDALTGCLNRRAFAEDAKRVLPEARASGLPLSILMIDIDRFKIVNDRFGHAAGDRVIQAVSATLLRGITKRQILCRMGGEEFALVLPGDSLQSATFIAERLRRAVSSSPVALDENNQAATSVTVSIGAAELEYADVSLFTVLGRADRAVYRAKHRGRNRVEVEPDDRFPLEEEDEEFSYHRRSRA